MEQEITLAAPAKVNLTLDILGQRADGYHELESVMQQITLFDFITLRRSEHGLQLYCSHPLVPEGADNIAYQAALLMLEKLDSSVGLEISIEKNIPVGAGLAGGSTDAAAVLMGINTLMELDLSLPELMAAGSQLGSDIPFCIQGGTALARGRGEIITPLPAGPVLQLVLVKPDFSLSTAEVYRRFRMEKVGQRPGLDAFLAAWTQYDMINMVENMTNVLETVTLSLCPEIQTIKQELMDSGAIQAIMSGSGPTVFGVFPDLKTAGIAYQKMQQQYKEIFLATSYYGGDANEN
ncbi:MAG TPA: 4-(cytidine 5'-diphospho)-2-C-methyl-D-erythritol kinase [Syntrophomonadaceae bacterium]|nr:4-(cytidine 5'-diphospho)-2-C-methyl-D-erythritol kinase [Syntrophomonadaceae bacterium]